MSARYHSFLLLALFSCALAEAKPAKTPEPSPTVTPTPQTATPELPPEEKTLELLKFRLGQVSVFRKSGGSSYSGMFSWKPLFHRSSWRVSLNLGVTYLKATGTNFFLVTDYELFVGKKWKSMVFEFGLGAQSWFDYGGTHPVFSFSVEKVFAHPLLKIIDRGFISLSVFLPPSGWVAILQPGIGLGF